MLAAVQAAHATERLPLVNHWVGYAALAVFVLAYALVVLEEKLHLRKSKPVILAAGIIWILVAAAYAAAGDTTSAGAAIRHNVGEFAELLLFITVAVTFVNTMEERGIFEAMRAWLVGRGLTMRGLFWVTGITAFFVSSQLDNLTTALVLGTVVLTIGKDDPKFVAVGCINVVVAANAGGAWSPFGDITTLMVWQAGVIEFFEFYRLFVPSLVNWLVPAFFMSLVISRERPPAVIEDHHLKRGAFVVVGLFALTIALTVTGYNLLRLPPFIGMTTGLGLLKFYAYFQKRVPPREPREISEALSMLASPAENPPLEPALVAARTDMRVTATALEVSSQRILLQAPRRRHHEAIDVFAMIQKAEWDTLLFFYGIILAVGGLAQIGYLALASEAIYGGLGATAANAIVGVVSAVVDNIPVMFAVLSMRPEMPHSQWLLVTLTAGVGGSMLSVGSAAGVALMGQAKGRYTFLRHLRWTWAIALGYVASIWVHLLING